MTDEALEFLARNVDPFALLVAREVQRPDKQRIDEQLRRANCEENRKRGDRDPQSQMIAHRPHNAIERLANLRAATAAEERVKNAKNLERHELPRKTCGEANPSPLARGDDPGDPAKDTDGNVKAGGEGGRIADTIEKQNANDCQRHPHQRIDKYPGEHLLEQDDADGDANAQQNDSTDDDPDDQADGHPRRRG